MTIKKVVAYTLPILALSLVCADSALAQGGLENPLKGGGVNSIEGFVSSALKVMVMVALPIITLFMVYSGFLFVFAQGNQEALAKAKMNFLYVIIGAVLILGAWVLASLLGNTVNELIKTA